MNYATLGQTGPNYFPCRYGTSKQLFRGPRRRIEGDFVVFLGGTETYGKFIEVPFPAMIEHRTRIRSVNLGCMNAGVDLYCQDRSLLDICNKARVTVIQAMGAQNMSNRFYAVHPRRNDRFLKASTLLQKIFPEVDFTEFAFTRHLLSRLAQISPERFAMLRHELKEAWLARMRTLLSQIDGKTVLLWLADHPPPPEGSESETGDPLFVDRAMLQSLGGAVTRTVQIVATPEERAAGLERMQYGELDRPAAAEMLGPVLHERLAATLAPVLEAMM